MEVNTKDLVSKAHAHETASNTLRVIQYLLAATVAFDLVDRFTALDLSVYVDMSVENMAQTPEWQRGKPHEYRWHLGCILLKMPAIFVRTGAGIQVRRVRAHRGQALRRGQAGVRQRRGVLGALAEGPAECD